MKEEPNSILIIKLSAIGDVVHTLPLLEVLRQNFPHCRIDWLVEEEASQLIDGHEGLDHLIVSQRRSWQRRVLKGGELWGVFREVKRFLKDLRSVEYDVVMDLQGLFKSGLLTGISRGKRKIGFTGAREGSILSLTERPSFFDYDKHALDRYLKVTEYLRGTKRPWKGDIPIREADKRYIDEIIQENGLKKEKLVAINPMARWRTKLWETGSFAVLADRLQKELSCHTVFTGSRADRSTIDEIIRIMDGKAINLAGRTSLKELAYLYARCRLMISTDTGPMHVAAAMGCAVVALFGPTAPWRTGPYGEGHKVIREDLECSPCFKKRCARPVCMKNITVEKVFETVKGFFPPDLSGATGHRQGRKRENEH
ncbi:MAG: lipopolysaccharide heptosyltransferase II [Pseudomonadota bacterium]